MIPAAKSLFASLATIVLAVLVATAVVCAFVATPLISVKAGCVRVPAPLASNAEIHLFACA
jgi:hypothetical protein